MTTTTSNHGGVQTVRRIILFTLLFVMVVIAAIGLSGLLARLLEAGSRIVANDPGGLAQALAFTLIGGPLAALLWWLVWRGLADDRDRASVAWALYLAIASTVALITFASSLLSALSALIDGRVLNSEFGTGLVWMLVWLWHRWMWRHPAKGPSRLSGVAPTIGAFFGLVVAVSGAVGALGTLFSAATDALSAATSVGGVWWLATLQLLVWAIGGGLIWWWHWVHDNVRKLQTGFAQLVLVIVTGFGAPLLCLAGIATTLFVLLRLAFDRGDPLTELLDPLGVALAAAAIGAVVWVYHRGVVAQQLSPVRQATRLVTSGVALAATASGMGIIVNSILAGLGSPLADGGVRALLLGGISAFIVGGTAWWAFWKPMTQHGTASQIPVSQIPVSEPPGAEPHSVAPERPPAQSTGYRVYLVTVFGVSALVALITLLVIAFRIFEFTLDQVSGESLLERVRAPLGLLTATALVAGYHFAIWRRGRAAVDSPAANTISQVILVTGANPEPLRRWIDDTVGASVTVWTRADSAGDDREVRRDQLAAALTEVNARRVLLVVEADGQFTVVPLAS